MSAHAVVCRSFIGRDNELLSLEQQRESARKRRGGLVLVAGEAGIGKTRLVTQFRESLLKARVRIAISHCREFVQRPYAPVLDILGQLGPPAGALAEPVSRADHFEAILAAFRQAAQRRAVLAVIEDVHWADPASLELLAAVVRAFEADRLLIVATYRPEGIALTRELGGAFAKLQRLRNTTTLTLEPLREGELRDFIGQALEGVADLPADTRANVVRLSEGNPFFAEELLKNAVDRARTEPVKATLPTTLRAAITDRLLPLDPGDRDILAQAAVIGRTFSLVLLQKTLGRSRQEVLAALRRARDLQLVGEEGGEDFSFRHALTREVIYTNFLELQARDLHRRIARTLEKLPAPTRSVEALAYHWWAAGDRVKGCLYGERAGDAATAVFAHEDAIAFYRYALDSVAAGSVDEARLHRKIGNAYAASGNHTAARDAHARAMRLFGERGPLAEECDCAGLLAVDLQRLGDPARVAPLEELMARIDRGEHGALWAALGVRAALLHPLPDNAPRVRALLSEVEPYLGARDSPERLRFHGARAELMRSINAVDEYAAELETVLAMATRLERVDAKANTLANAAHAFTVLGRPHLASAYFDQAIAFALLHRLAGTLSLAYSWQALHLFFIGELAAARESLSAAQRGTTDNVLVRVNVAAWGTLVAQFLDDRALAERCFDERLLNDGAVWAVYLAASYAAYMEDRDRHAEARALLHACLDGRDYEPGLALTLLAVARLGSLDDVPVARRLLVCGVERRDLVYEAALPHFDALVERRCGNRSRAATSAGQAVAGYQRLGYLLLEAEAHDLAGRPDMAAALYRKCGAVGPLARLAKHAPAPPKPGKPASPAAARNALTPREHEVAALVTRGLSNLEIAERLALSSKGVEKHLSAIHRKTGVRSRARLVVYLLGVSSGDVRV